MMELLTVSKELELSTHMSAQEIRRELAVHLYSQGKLSAGKARELAAMGVIEFQCLLGSRGIAVNYSEDDWRDDLNTITRLQLDQ
jgi:predicted HTH domain antitoxin